MLLLIFSPAFNQSAHSLKLSYTSAKKLSSKFRTFRNQVSMKSSSKHWEMRQMQETLYYFFCDCLLFEDPLSSWLMNMFQLTNMDKWKLLKRFLSLGVFHAYLVWRNKTLRKALSSAYFLLAYLCIHKNNTVFIHVRSLLFLPKMHMKSFTWSAVHFMINF